MFEKIAEQRSRIPPLAKKNVAPSCQSSDGWIFEKTVKWSVGEGRRHSVTAAQSLIQNTTYKPSTCAASTNEILVLGC